jgi:hypothetical protein
MNRILNADITINENKVEEHGFDENEPLRYFRAVRILNADL